MTHESIPPPAVAACRSTRSSGRRPNADYRWTARKAMAFLDLLAAGESVAAAARRVGMSRQSAYRLRTRAGEHFAQGWDLPSAPATRGARRRGSGSGEAQGDRSAPQGDRSLPQGDTRTL